MLRQSNLVPPFAAQFDCSRHTCMGDIFMAPTGLQILVLLTKTHQLVSRAPVLPILGVPGHPTYLVAAYRLLLAASPTTLADQPLLTYLHLWCCTTVTVPILSRALAAILHDFGMMPTSSPSHPPHSLHRGGGGGGGEPQWVKVWAWTRSTSSGTDCGLAMPSGKTSPHHAMPPRP